MVDEKKPAEVKGEKSDKESSITISTVQLKERLERAKKQVVKQVVKPLHMLL